MEDFTSLDPVQGNPDSAPLVYFWAFGDLHYRARKEWHAMHSRRLAPMFQDLHALWLDEGAPAFCVSPGDIVDTGAPENYTLARKDLAAQLGNVPFYPGIGNHEYHREARENRDEAIHTSEEYSVAWGKPPRYSWLAGRDGQTGLSGEVVCIMLDQPDPFEADPMRENPRVIFSRDTLNYLDATLEQHAGNIAIIFAHCPLHNTVLDRDPERNLDDDSLDPFFHIENSDEMRAILARHANAALYISGHTHSGWGSPNLVLTEMLEEHPVTHANLMSPWYTGRHRGPRLSADRLTLEYSPDDPDVLVSFAVRIYRRHALIAARDHRAHRWLAQWTVPIDR
jgi:hypothetical protein